MKNNEAQGLPTVLRLFHRFILKRTSTTKRQQIKQLFRMVGQTIFSGIIKLMAELFIVAEWVTSCQLAPSLMLAHLFFFFLKNAPTPWRSSFERRIKNLSLRVLLVTMIEFLSSKRREGELAALFHLQWLYIARLRRRKPTGKWRAACLNTLDFGFDQKFSRRPVDVSQVPLARCKGSHPCTWSCGLWAGSCDACTGPSPVRTCCFFSSEIGQSGNPHKFKVKFITFNP